MIPALDEAGIHVEGVLVYSDTVINEFLDP